MSVELDNLSGNQKEVNTFLPPLRIFTVNIPLSKNERETCFMPEATQFAWSGRPRPLILTLHVWNGHSCPLLLTLFLTLQHL